MRGKLRLPNANQIGATMPSMRPAHYAREVEDTPPEF